MAYPLLFAHACRPAASPHTGITIASTTTIVVVVLRRPAGRLEGIDNVRLAFKGLAEVLEFKVRGVVSVSLAQPPPAHRFHRFVIDSDLLTALVYTSLCMIPHVLQGFDRFECVDATSEGLRFEIVCHYRLKPIGPNIPFR